MHGSRPKRLRKREKEWEELPMNRCVCFLSAVSLPCACGLASSFLSIAFFKCDNAQKRFWAGPAAPHLLHPVDFEDVGLLSPEAWGICKPLSSLEKNNNKKEKRRCTTRRPWRKTLSNFQGTTVETNTAATKVSDTKALQEHLGKRVS